MSLVDADRDGRAGATLWEVLRELLARFHTVTTGRSELAAAIECVARTARQAEDLALIGDEPPSDPAEALERLDLVEHRAGREEAQDREAARRVIEALDPDLGRRFGEAARQMEIGYASELPRCKEMAARAADAATAQIAPGDYVADSGASIEEAVAWLSGTGPRPA
jgi:hypothetical protein